MKKDIVVPKVEDVYVAAVKEYNEIHRTEDWNIYIINNKSVALEMILIVSTGYSSDKITSTMRHKLEALPPKSYAKVELIMEDLLSLKNEFLVTFFQDNKMYDKSFVFEPNTINNLSLKKLPLIKELGVLAN
ncbi:MAG: hypothetical protein ACPH12_01810 [Flavobacteriaceae bacterium]